MKRGIIMAGLVVTGLFLSLNANATLILTLNGMAVYDTDLDITWLADANAGAGTAFDTGASTVDGRLTWQSANDWAANLTVEGSTDWRLPTTTDPDATCTDDQAGMTLSTDPNGFNCTGSEMGHLFYTELAGTAGSSILTSGDPDLALFNNIQGGSYWSGTTRVGTGDLGAWVFGLVLTDPLSGLQSANTKTDERAAWAVHDGNPGGAVVPIPAAVWLFGSALGLLAWMRRRKTA